MSEWTYRDAPLSLDPEWAHELAQAFHEAYERLAPDYGYETREASAKPWSEVPQQNRDLMVASIADLMRRGIIKRGGQ